MAFKMKGPLKHMGYEVNIKKGKVVSEKEKPHNKFKTETEHEEYHDTYPSKPFTDAEGKPFKMKGSPMKRNFGIGADSPMKETTNQTLQGMSFDPYAHRTLSADDIPSFRDMVSLEQQQAARKAWKEKRADRKLREAGGGTLDELEIKEEERRKDIAKEPPTTEVFLPKEVKPENEINIGSNANSYGI